MNFTDTILYNIWNIFVEGKRNERFSDLKNLVPELTGNSEYADRRQDDSYVVEKRLALVHLTRWFDGPTVHLTIRAKTLKGFGSVNLRFSSSR